MSNSSLDSFPTTLFARTKRSLFRVVGGVAQLLPYLSPVEPRIVANAVKNTLFTAHGGVLRLMGTYARVRLKALRWISRTVHIAGLEHVHPHVPASAWENELVSVLDRATPYDGPVSIDPRITTAAANIALRLGKINSPLDFDEWLKRYPTHRQEELRAALNKPYNTTVDTFHKVEKLDDTKTPRTIQARNDAYKARVGPWMAALEARATEVLPLVKGLDPDERALRVQQLRQRALNVVEVDYSRFDRHCTIKLLQNTEHLVYRHCFPEAIYRLLADQLTTTCKLRHGASYTVEGTRLSGDVNTSIGNCIVNLCLIMAAGLPSDAVLVEGDDMIAAPTDAELAGLDMDVITATGMKPTLKINPQDGGAFCSRYDVDTATGPRRVRHPVRDLTRFGWSLKGAPACDIIADHLAEWNGVPMLGPVYIQTARQHQIDTPSIPITIQARASFHRVFGINADTQIRFETCPEARAQIFEEIAADYSARVDSSPVQGTPTTCLSGDDTESVLPRSDGTASPRRQSSDVRDVQTARPCQDRVQDSSGNNHGRRGNHRHRFRPTRRNPDVQWHRSPVTKGNNTSVEERDPVSASRVCHETEVAQHAAGNRRPRTNAKRGRNV